MFFFFLKLRNFCTFRFCRPNNKVSFWCDPNVLTVFDVAQDVHTVFAVRVMWKQSTDWTVFMALILSLKLYIWKTQSVFIVLRKRRNIHDPTYVPWRLYCFVFKIVQVCRLLKVNKAAQKWSHTEKCDIINSQHSDPVMNFNRKFWEKLHVISVCENVLDAGSSYWKNTWTLQFRKSSIRPFFKAQASAGWIFTRL